MTYKELVKTVLDRGTLVENRTGINALTIPSFMLTHDMEDGFPLTTLRRCPYKSMAVELEGFINGITDKRWFQERGCSFWNWWSNPEDLDQFINQKDYQIENPDLGPLGYSHGWRNFNGHHKPIPFIFTDLDKTITLEYNDDPNNLVGLEVNSKYGKYTVVSYDGINNNHIKEYSVKFQNTGYIAKKVAANTIKQNKSIKDPYFPSVAKVACMGEYSQGDLSNKELDDLKNQWRGMINRCYNKNNSAYPNYGDKGVYVANSWLIFARFIEDIQNIPGWNEKRKNWKTYQLDKDISKSKKYGPKTCQWVTRQTNTNHTSLNYYTENEKIDQFSQIINKLKSDPSDRRMLCSAWNPIQNPKAALPPCHVLFKIQHINGTLHLTWYQRSTDIILGTPSNLPSYALLLMLICKEVGMTPGTVTGFLNDCHIYENHLDGAKELVTRDEYAFPQLEITNFTGIYEWTAKDIELTNYKYHPKIKFDVAV